LPSSKQEALQVYQHVSIDAEPKQDTIEQQTRPQISNSTKNVSFFDDEHSPSNENNDGESFFAN